MKEEAPFLRSVIGMLIFFSATHMVLEMQYFIWSTSNGNSMKSLQRMYTASDVAYENRCYFWLLQNFMMASNFVLLSLFLGFTYMKNLRWLYFGIGVSALKLILAIIWQSLISDSFITQSLQTQLACDEKTIQEDGYTTTQCNMNDLFLLERKMTITISIIQLALSLITPSYIKFRKYELNENEPLIFSESLLN